MADTSNRTFVCSVLFLDIEGYSKRSVAEQLRLKQQLNALMVKALQHVPASDRIVLDTGDGAAISFLGNPEDALFVAMDLRDGIAAQGAEEALPLHVRMGINLGPVRLIKDFNGQLNIIGDGINVAQRVMGFAGQGSILVSRSYYEVMSRLSDDYAKIFQYEGTRTDKHVREHAVYMVGAGVTGLPDPRAGHPSAATETAGPPAGKGWLLKGVVLLAVVIIAAGIGVRMGRGGKEAAGGAAPASVTAVTPATSPAAPAPEAETRKPAKAEKAPAVKPAPDPAPPPQEGMLLLTIVPWGEVFVDGRNVGVSPPLKSLPVAPGSHKIEIRNGGFPAYVEKIEIRSGEQRKIRHKF
jgi:class 3 adenylate cyclase